MVDTLERRGGIQTLPVPDVVGDIALPRPTRGGLRVGRVLRPLLLIALLGGVGWYVHSHPELIDQGKKAAQNWMLENSFLKDPKIFDNQDTYGQISPLNSVALPLEVIKERTRIEPGKAIHIGSFFQTPVPAEIKYVKGLPYFGPTSGITNPEDAPEYNRYLKEGVKNAIAFTNIPLGTVVHAPFKGKVSTFERQSDFFSLNLEFTDQEGNEYGLLFSGAKNVEEITHAPRLNPKKRFRNLDEWLNVELGQPLFVIRSEELVGGNQGFNYYSQLKIEASYSPNGRGKIPAVPIDIFFVNEGDKVVVPAE